MSVNRNGREYVTQAEFARFANLPYSSVKTMVARGQLELVEMPDTGKKLLDKEMMLIRYKTLMHSKRKKKAKTERSPLIKVSKARTPSAPEIAEPKAPDIPDEHGNADFVDARKIDPYDYPECWVYGTDGEPAINPATNKPTLDLTMLRDYLTGVKYQLDIDQKRGLLIPKTEVQFGIQEAMSVISKELTSIPRKYGEILYAQVEMRTGVEMSAQQKAELTEVLDGKPAEIMASIRQALLNLIEEPEQKETKGKKEKAR